MKVKERYFHKRQDQKMAKPSFARKIYDKFWKYWKEKSTGKPIAKTGTPSRR